MNLYNYFSGALTPGILLSSYVPSGQNEQHYIGIGDHNITMGRLLISFGTQVNIPNNKILLFGHLFDMYLNADTISTNDHLLIKLKNVEFDKKLNHQIYIHRRDDYLVDLLPDQSISFYCLEIGNEFSLKNDNGRPILTT
jgi:hypothetical protein